MRRLYVRIYLAVLGSLALFALLTGLTWRLFSGFETMGPGSAFFTEAADRLAPPAGAALEAQRQQLERWRTISGYDVALFAPTGELVAQSANANLPAPASAGSASPAWHWRGPFGGYAVRLSDGRWLVAARPEAERGLLHHFGWLLALFGIAGAVGVSAYPVVRRLTRGLEQLESSVEALGAGDLSARVTISGRDEVARLGRKFNQAAERIEQLIASNKSLLANASHELRSPLARLRMGIEETAGAVPVATQAELSRNIRELDQLIEEILLASRLEAQSADPINLVPVDLIALTAEECARTDAELASIPEGGIVLPADERLMRRLIRNLLENAKRHAGASKVDVELRSSASEIELNVLDRGPGVPEAERERIFEPFYRQPGTREREGSVGLGLSLARQIAKRHGGTIVCLPRPGGGSCFRVSLPVTTAT